nr:hypothetical protein [Tanacetum cinerariifolium]
MANDEEDHALVADEEAPTEFALIANTNPGSKELKTLKKEKERVDGKLEGFLTASKDLDNLIKSQRSDKNKEGLGYSVVPPPPAQIYSSPKKDLSWTGLLEFADDMVTDYSWPSPTMESTLGDDQNRNHSVFETGASPSTITPKPFIKFVKPNDSPSKSKTGKTETPKKPPVKKRVKKGTSRSQNNIYESFTPRPVVHRPYRPLVKPMRTNMNGARLNITSFNKQAHSYPNRPFQRTLAVRSQFRAPWVPTANRNFPPVSRKFSTVSRNFPTVNRKFPTANRKFSTSGIKFSTADMRKKGKDVKPSACWFWKPSQNLSNKEPFDGGYVSFGQGGCKITGKGTIKTGKLEFENVYFVKDLKDFKLLDDANILLSTPRQHNMYSIDLNNIVPHKDLTCLVAKASADEWMLWHRRLGKFKAKGDEGYFIGYSMSSKAFRVLNKRTKRVEENLHVEFLENKAIEKGDGLNWLFDIDSITKSMNFVPVDAGINSTNLSESSSSKPQDDCSTDVLESNGNLNPTASTTYPPADQLETLVVESLIPTVSSPVLTACFNDSPEPSSDVRLISKRVANQVETPYLDNILTLLNRFEDILGITTNSDESNGVEADVSNMETTITASPTPTLRIHKDHPKTQIISPVDTLIQTRNKSKQMDVKSAFLYGTIDEEVKFEALMHEKFQMSAMGELNFFLGLQVLQKEDGIFLSQDKYVGDILKKFGYSDVRSSNTPMDKENPWEKTELEKIRLISWQCKKQTIMATSTTEAEYVAAASCCGQVLWIQNQCKLFPLVGKLSTVSVFLGFGLTFTDEPASPLRDVSQGEACPTDSGFITDQDMANIAKSSTLPHDPAPRVTSPTAVEGSMQHTIDELMDLCTSLQRVKLLEYKEGVAAERSGDDAPIKGRNLDEGEAAAERVSDDSEEMATVLTSMDAATVLAGGVAKVPTGSGSIPTASHPATGVATGSDVVPTASPIFATATESTQYTRRKGKETMSQQRKPLTKKHQREFYTAVLRNQAGWKEVPEEVKSLDEVPEEKVKEMMQLVPIEKVYVEALQVKHPIIDRKVHTEGKRSYWKITRLRGSSASYQFFVDILKHLDREDLNQLWRIVKESLSNRPPTSDKEMELWVELNRLYDPDEDDQLWTHTQNLMHAPVEWKLYDSCGLHYVTAKDKEIFMLVEKDYPLKKGLAIVMISYMLQVKNYSRMANDLILKIFKISSTPRQQVIEFPLAEEVPTASEESFHCQKKRDAIAKRIALLGKCPMITPRL